ncbi:MAG: DUF4142 domain-containing protein [Verrucomicrobiota bacterium]|nr:DUF4142 domain-containing protein [Verrucomicrobiota bacterium]
MKTTMRWIVGVMGAGASLAAATAFASDYYAPPANPPPRTVFLSPRQFVNDAIWGGDKEIAMGQLAMVKSRTEAVTNFADRMIRDQTRANEKIMAIADSEGLSYPPTNVVYFIVNPYPPSLTNPKGLPAEALMQTPWEIKTNGDILTFEQLQALNGPDFDRAYAADAVADHAATVGEFEDAVSNLYDPRLKARAQRLLPVLQRHYDKAQRLQHEVALATPAVPPPTPP